MAYLGNKHEEDLMHISIAKINNRMMREGKSTQTAEEYGFRLGYNNTSPYAVAANFRNSINKGIGAIWMWLKSKFK